MIKAAQQNVNKRPHFAPPKTNCKIKKMTHKISLKTFWEHTRPRWRSWGLWWRVFHTWHRHQSLHYGAARGWGWPCFRLGSGRLNKAFRPGQYDDRAWPWDTPNSDHPEISKHSLPNALIFSLSLSPSAPGSGPTLSVISRIFLDPSPRPLTVFQSTALYQNPFPVRPSLLWQGPSCHLCLSFCLALLWLFWDEVSLYTPGWSWTFYVSQVGLNCTILLPQHLK